MSHSESFTSVHNEGKPEVNIGLRDEMFTIRRNAQGQIEIVDTISGEVLPLKVASVVTE